MRKRTGQIKRKYVKRDCSYWEHDYEFLGFVEDSETHKNIGGYFKCHRCGHSTISRGCSDLMLGVLIDTTLKDLPKYSVEPDLPCEFMGIYK